MSAGKIIVAIGMNLLCLLSGCGTAPVARSPGDAAAETLRQRAEEWDRAIVAKDPDGIASGMAEDFRQVDRTGAVRDRNEFLRAVLDSRLEIEPYTVEDLDIRLYGNTALVTGRTDMTGRYDGRPFASSYRFVDVYLRRNGEWQVVHVQITGLSGAAPPAK